MKILRTGAGSVTSECVINELKRLGCDVLCADADPESYGLYKYGGILIAKPPEYPYSILDIIDDYKIDYVIPACDQEIFAWGEFRNERIITSRYSTLLKFKGKEAVYWAFREAGLKTPRRLSGVVIQKNEIISGGKGTQILSADNEKLIYAFVRGQEYTVDVLCDREGKIICGAIRERNAQSAGKSIKGRTVWVPEIWEDVEKLCDAYRFFGPFCVQCIMNEEGVFWFDFNPRYSGGLSLSIKAGAPMVENLVKVLKGEKIEYTGCARKEVKMFRYMTEIYLE